MADLPGFNRDELLDSLVAVVPISIIVVLTLLFVAYNPWGWEELSLIAIVFGLHLVPIVTLAPIMFVLVRILVEADSTGRSETARQLKAWFATAETDDHRTNGHTEVGNGTDER